MSAQFASWKGKETEAQKKIDAKRKELEALKVSFDMSYISKLAADEASQAQSVKNLKTWVPHLADTKKRRAIALTKRWEERDRVATLRETFGRQATATLREALSDLQVSLKYARNAYAPDAANLIIEVMGWKTNQQPRAAWLVETLTVPVLLEAVRRKNASPVLALKTPEGVDISSATKHKRYWNGWPNRQSDFALERATLHDLPRLQVSRQVPDGKGGHDTSFATSQNCRWAKSNRFYWRLCCLPTAISRSSSINPKTILTASSFIQRWCRSFVAPRSGGKLLLSLTIQTSHLATPSRS